MAVDVRNGSDAGRVAHDRLGATRAYDLVWDTPAGDLKVMVDKTLVAMGVAQDAVDRFLRHAQDSLTLQVTLATGLGVGKKTFEDDLGIRGLKRLGRKKWQKRVAAVAKRFVSALLLDEVVLGGGNARKLTRLPLGCRLGDNANAFPGGFRLWEKEAEQS